MEPTRPTAAEAKKVNLDVKIKGPEPYTHADIKNPVGSKTLAKQNQNTTIEKMSYDIGQNIVKQKELYISEESGSVSSENVLHIVDMCYVPSTETAIVKNHILKGALDKGSDDGIVFLNEKK